MKNTVCDKQHLVNLCIKNHWFTEGTNKQYEKLFYANQHGCPIEEIATIIWVCSEDGCFRRDILDELKTARTDFWKRMFSVEDETQTFQVWDVFGVIHEAPFTHIIDLLVDPDIDDFKYEHITGIYTLDGETVWESEN